MSDLADHERSLETPLHEGQAFENVLDRALVQEPFGPTRTAL